MSATLTPPRTPAPAGKTAGDEGLSASLRARIRRDGPLTFRDFMSAALYDPESGYYTNGARTRWGRGGDYRTAPERSTLFAATFAHYFASLHAQAGAPGTWTWLEAGAGAGDFALTFLRALAQFHSETFRATRYVIDELSGESRILIGEKLAPFADKVSFTRLKETPIQSVEGVIFANELLDALPCHRVRRSGGRLRELYVGLSEDDGLAWVEDELSDGELSAYFASAGVELIEGQIAEVCTKADAWVGRANSRLRRGYLVLVDYGAESGDLYDPAARYSGTLRGFSRHQLVSDVLARPGELDITASVNWSSVRAAGEGAGLNTVLFERQDQFMLQAGALEVLEQLTAAAPNEAERAALRLGAREMILPGGMSESFQVLVQHKS